MTWMTLQTANALVQLVSSAEGERWSMRWVSAGLAAAAFLVRGLAKGES